MVTDLSLAAVLFHALYLFGIGSAVAQSPIDRNQLSVRNRENCTLTSPPELHSLVSQLEKRFLVCGSSPPVCVKVARNQRLPCRVRPLFRLPALSLLPGQTVAQDAR